MRSQSVRQRLSNFYFQNQVQQTANHSFEEKAYYSILSLIFHLGLSWVIYFALLSETVKARVNSAQYYPDNCTSVRSGQHGAVPWQCRTTGCFFPTLDPLLLSPFLSRTVTMQKRINKEDWWWAEFKIYIYIYTHICAWALNNLQFTEGILRWNHNHKNNFITEISNSISKSIGYIWENFPVKRFQIKNKVKTVNPSVVSWLRITKNMSAISQNLFSNSLLPLKYFLIEKSGHL